MGNNNYNKLKFTLTIIFFFLLGVLGITFSILYVESFTEGFFFLNSSLINSLSVSLISVLTIITISFFVEDKKFIYKIFLLIISFVVCAILLLYLLKISGFLDTIKSIEEFRLYVSSFGKWTWAVFILCQILQVILLPIPAFITVGAGVLMYGPLLGSILSSIGIILGSIIAFICGKYFGYNIVKWLVGKDNLDKCLKFIKGKDKVVFTFMFLFPFFPDDVLCFVAGITTIRPLFFIIMITIVRFITCFLSSYSMNNSIIPYDTWWGILLWVCFFAITLFIALMIVKHGDKIEDFFTRKILRKNKQKL